MKVKIKKYTDYWGPYQIVDTIFFWAKDEDWVFNLGKKFSNTKLGDFISNVSYKYCQYKESKRVKVHIDDYDVWNFDDTLAHIILPGLKKLKEIKHGSGIIDNEDVPEELHTTTEEDINGHNKLHKKWDYVMDEMIWAFEEKLKDFDNQFFTENGYDQEGHLKHRARMRNGFRLFGAYYENLWD